jgi:hypothetical protein
MPPSFTLIEQEVFGTSYEWRLKDSEIRFRGTGECTNLVKQRIPASEVRVASFFSALELLQIWEWRSDYDPRDIETTVDDGSSWMFVASYGERQCRCGGVNAYPSFVDPRQTAMDRDRFGLLRAALYQCFGIDWYIQEAKRSGIPGEI